MTWRFLEGGGSGVLGFWLCEEMRQKPEKVARFIFRLNEAVIQKPFTDGRMEENSTHRMRHYIENL